MRLVRTDEHSKLIHHVKWLGFGYAKFAISVDSQETWITEKQVETLKRMLEKYDNSRKRNKVSSYQSPGYYDISDEEVMFCREYY